MKMKIAVLSGDGIGPEVMKEAVKVLKRVGEVFSHDFELAEALAGGAAYDEYKNHLPEETLKVCSDCEAILFGSVGGPLKQIMEPKWKDCEKNSIIGLRKYFGLNVNLRPSKVYSALKEMSVLAPHIIEKGVDILCIRELLGDVYLGEHKTEGVVGKRVATDLMIYDEETIENVVRPAFEAAMKRNKKLTSVDKANILDCSRLWREVVDRISREYPDVKLEHLFIDNASMQVIRRPFDFDVIVTSNLFGDILSDEISIFGGSLGMLPSASLNPEGFGLYEPAGGSAPDIAGKGIANPIAQILCVALMLKHSFNLNAEHDAIENALKKALEDGYRTIDIAGGGPFTDTVRMGDEIAKNIMKNDQNF